MPSYYCFVCGAQREHLNVKRTAELAQVTRATIYNWLHAGRLHVITHPSGRKFICTASVLGPHADVDCDDGLPAAENGEPRVVAFRNGPPLASGVGTGRERPTLRASAQERRSSA